MLKRLLITLCLSAGLTHLAIAEEITTAKQNDIRQLIEMTGGTNIAKLFASGSSQQMFKMLKASRPDIPDRALVIMEREMLALFSEKLTAPGGLMDMIVPIYAKHLSHQEIRELIAFYQTPLGRKTISVLPLVTQESMQAGQRWGQALGPEMEKRVIAALNREGLLTQK